MRTISLDESSRIAAHQVRRDERALAPGEVVVRPTHVLISREDVEVCRGLMAFRGVLGRDMVGVVEEIGGDVDGRWVGRRVAASRIVACRSCEWCRAGLAAQCRERLIAGMRGRDGCLSDRFMAPARSVVEVPPSIDSRAAVFANAAACALHTLRSFAVEKKPFITVLGDGLIGLLCAQFAARLNASVRVVGSFTERLSLCEKWGIKHRHVDDVGRRADQDIVIDCSDTPEGLALALRFVRPRGVIVMKSLFAPQAWRACGDGIDLTRLVTDEISLLGSFEGSAAEGLRAIEQGRVDVGPLITTRSRLDEGRSILERAAQPHEIAVLVEV